ncbi:MAG: glycosyltransferase family 39 protein [Nitrospirota bacterium]
MRMLLMLLSIAFVLRIWGIWNIEQTDEFNEVFEALKVDSGNLNFDRWNKKVLIYILAIEYGIYFGIGWVIGLFHSVSDFASKIVVDMSPLFIIGRATSAIFGTAIVFVTYAIGKRLFNRETGLFAALFLCFNFVHVEHSHLVLVDITMTLMLTISFYFATLMMRNGGKRSYYLAGLFAGLAIVAKIPSIFILVSIGTSHLIYCRKKSINIKGIFLHKHILFVIFGIVSGAILGNPAILLGLPKYLGWLKMLFGAYRGTSDQIDYWSPINGYRFYIVSLYQNMGLPLFILTILGLIYFIFKPKKEVLLLLSFALPFYIFMANSKWVLTHRYMIPIYPFLSIIAGAFFFEITQGLKNRKKLIIIATIFLLVIPVKNVMLFEISLLQQNTRYWAKEWIEANIPKGSKILIDAGRTINTSSPPIFNNRKNVLLMINKIEKIEEGKTFDDSRIVDNRSVIYFKYLLNNLPDITYDLTSTELGRNIKGLEYYRNQGYDYIIISSGITWVAWNENWAKKHPVSADFYRSLDQELELIKFFAPSRTRNGPVIKIYKVK